MLDEPNPQFWTNTELTLWLNEGCVDIARRAEILRQTDTIDVSADTQNYDAPDDCYRIYRIHFLPTGTTLMYPIEFRGYQGMDQYWGNLPQLPAAWPALYTLWYSPVGANASPTPGSPNAQMQITLYPVPSQDGQLVVFYYRLAVPMVDTTDTLDVTPGFEDVVYDYCVYKAYRKDASPLWKDQQAIYEQKLQDLIDITRTWSDQSEYASTGPVGQPAWLTGGYDAY